MNTWNFCILHPIRYWYNSH